MTDPSYRDEIVRLEEEIDELAARIESCRKFILAGRILVIGGGAGLAILIGALQFNPSVMAVGDIPAIVLRSARQYPVNQRIPTPVICITDAGPAWWAHRRGDAAIADTITPSE